ncbi:hypothetical protein FQN57_007367 [Myotisia sp. PD_48]|nr:hypothetical protein FQN57_007367 [Myotisia sp. PD_48]
MPMNLNLLCFNEAPVISQSTLGTQHGTIYHASKDIAGVTDLIVEEDKKALPIEVTYILS